MKKLKMVAILIALTGCVTEYPQEMPYYPQPQVYQYYQEDPCQYTPYTPMGCNYSVPGPVYQEDPRQYSPYYPGPYGGYGRSYRRGR